MNYFHNKLNLLKSLLLTSVILCVLASCAYGQGFDLSGGTYVDYTLHPEFNNIITVSYGTELTNILPIRSSILDDVMVSRSVRLFTKDEDFQAIYATYDGLKENDFNVFAADGNLFSKNINTSFGINVLDGASLLSMKAGVGIDMGRITVNYAYHNSISAPDNAIQYFCISYSIDSPAEESKLIASAQVYPY
ncbi:hypothetical protein ACFL4F_01580 [Candidatus Margulisiibacteriota bacterium]